MQTKVIRIITFNNLFTLAEPLFKELKILPFCKMIQIQDCYLVLNHLHNNLPDTSIKIETSSNIQIINKSSTNNQHHTWEAYNNKVNTPHVKPTHYGLESLKYKAAKSWDEIQKELKRIDFSDEYLSKIKFSKVFRKHFFDNGDQLMEKP